MSSQLVRYYACQTCGTRRGQFVTDAPEVVPVCCAAPMQWLRTSTYSGPPPRKFGQAPAIDFKHTSPLEIPIGADGPVQVESLRELRALEREAEKMAADGIGQPLVVRGYSQDRSNRHVNVFGSVPDHRPNLTRTTSTGVPRVSVTGGVLPDDLIDEMGPGAREDLASPLPMEPA